MAVEQDSSGSGISAGALYRDLLDSAADVIAAISPDGRIMFVNRAVTAVLGFRPEQLVGKHMLDYVHPDDVAAAAPQFEARQGGRRSAGRAAVCRLRCLDGSYRHLEMLASDPPGAPAIDGSCLVARDVTARVAAESARVVEEARHRLAAEVARMGIWEWNVETNELVADDAVRALARQRPDQTWGGPQEFLQRFVPEDRVPLEKAIRAAAAGHATCRMSGRMLMPDGSCRWLYVYAQRRCDAEARSPWVLGLIMDVTDQKLAELEAARRDELLELASWGADLGVWTWYPARDRALIDSRSARLLGLPPGDHERTTFECNSNIHPDDLPELTRLETELVEGRRDFFDYSYRVQRDASGWHWLLDRGRVGERDAAGRAVRVSGVTLDIDAAKRREQELDHQRLQLDLALSASQLGLWDLDVDSNALFVDRRYTEITGLTAQAVQHNHRAIEERLHDDDRQRLRAVTRACLEGRARTLSFEGRLLGPDGRLSWIAAEGFVAKSRQDGSAARLIGTLADVTERRRIEQLTRVGEFVAGSGSYEFDFAADRFYWSEGSYRLFDLPDETLPVYATLQERLQPASRAALDRAFAAAREKMRGFDLELEARSSRGRHIWIRMVGRIESFQGKTIRIYGILQDITQRRRLEAAIVETADREQRRLGRELHDGLGQELAGIAMLLQGMAQQSSESIPELSPSFERLSSMLSASIRSARMLARGLAPVSPGQGGLAGALQALTEQCAVNYGIPVSLEFDLRQPLQLGETGASDLYRIAQEALNNALRHGRPTQVFVRLASAPGSATLEVLDDGRGIARQNAGYSGMGLESMAYRAHKLGGSLVVDRRPTGGTRVFAAIPLPA